MRKGFAPHARRRWVSLLGLIFSGFIALSMIGPAFALLQARNTPTLQLFQGDGSNFVLRQFLEYEIERTGAVIFVPEGFVTDFASVPWFARSIIAVLGRHSVPAIVHDFLYWEQSCKRKEADLIMFDAMDEYDSNWFQKNAVYWSIRLFAGGAWSDNKADYKKGLVRVIPPEFVDIPPNTIWEQYRKDLFAKGVRPPTSRNSKKADYCKIGSN